MFFADETEHGKPFIHPYIPLPVYKAFMSELLLRNILMDKKIDRDTSIVRVNKHAVSAIETYIFGKKVVRTEITLNKKNIEEPILFGGPGATGGGGSIKRKIKP